MVNKYLIVFDSFMNNPVRLLKKKIVLKTKIKKIFCFRNLKKLLKHKYYNAVKLNSKNIRLKKYRNSLLNKYCSLQSLISLKYYKQEKIRNLYSLLINIFVKNGNVSQIKKSIDNVFIQLVHEFKITQQLLLIKIFTIHMFYVEVKKVKSRRRINHVPFLINQKRSFYLLLAWLRDAVNNNNQANNFEDKLYRELYNLLIGKQSKVFESIENNNKLAILNRSKLHFRW